MSPTIRCECGARLVEDVAEDGVRPVGGDRIVRFRRTTDYIVCARCLRTYRARDLIARAEDTEVIDLLERIARRLES